jgi:hypothetical protein
MPTFTGVSGIGWQFLGGGALSERLLLLQVPSIPLPPTRKIGYMAVYQYQFFGAPSSLPVFVQGASIWANGVLIDQPVPRSQQRNDVWVYWREAGIDWILTTRV